MRIVTPSWILNSPSSSWFTSGVAPIPDFSMRDKEYFPQWSISPSEELDSARLLGFIIDSSFSRQSPHPKRYQFRNGRPPNLHLLCLPLCAPRFPDRSQFARPQPLGGVSRIYLFSTPPLMDVALYRIYTLPDYPLATACARWLSPL